MPRPWQVDFLISACSSVVLTPSMAAMVANRIGVRRDAVTYALGGQGCTAGVIAVDLARRLMQARPQLACSSWLAKTRCNWCIVAPACGSQLARIGAVLLGDRSRGGSHYLSRAQRLLRRWQTAWSIPCRLGRRAWRWWSRASLSRTAWAPATTWSS